VAMASWDITGLLNSSMPVIFLPVMCHLVCRSIVLPLGCIAILAIEYAISSSLARLLPVPSSLAMYRNLVQA
jgi:hypothetical protein